MINTKTHQQITDCLELLKDIFDKDLLGVYLYGSALVGGLQKYSDVDLFVVTKRVMSAEEKAQLVSELLQISGAYLKSTKRCLEITIVEQRMVNPWHYPPCFDFQYGEWLRESFENGIIQPLAPEPMPDLSIIITQVLLKSQTLWGPDAAQLLAPVPYRDFTNAMTNDLQQLTANLNDDTRNVLLTLARIWRTITTNQISSKPEAANWAINHLPPEYQAVMQRAKAICIGTEPEHWNDLHALIRPCADFMINKINARVLLINFDDNNQRISLAE